MQTFVIVRNLTKGISGLTDHRSSPIALAAYGTKGDAIKILVDDMPAEKAVSYYRTLRSLGSFQVTFSAGLDDSKEDPLSKTTVVSTANVDQALSDKVAWLRQKVAKENADKKTTEMRLARARAMNTIQDNSTSREAMTNKTVPDLRTPEAAPEPVATHPVTGEEDKGIELTYDNLVAMNRTTLFEIATGMGLVLKRNASIGGIVKAILLNVKK